MERAIASAEHRERLADERSRHNESRALGMVREQEQREREEDKILSRSERMALMYTRDVEEREEEEREFKAVRLLSYSNGNERREKVRTIRVSARQ